MSKLVLRNVSRTIRQLHRGGQPEPDAARGRAGLAARPVRLRQDDDAAHDRRLHRRPPQGTIELDGEVISSPQSSLPPEKRKMSMIFQSYAIWPNMTVEENVGYGLKLRKVPAAEARRRIDEMLEVVQLGQLRDRYPAELSGGQQQRVALARAIVVKPAVLLLDEPLSNLDANLREEMRFEIRRLHDEFKMTMVYVTHDQAEAMVTSDRIAVMNQGRIEQIDAPFELYRNPKTKFVAGFIGRTNFLTGRSRAGEVDFGGFFIPTPRPRGRRHSCPTRSRFRSGRKASICCATSRLRPTSAAASKAACSAARIWASRGITISASRRISSRCA